MPRPRDAVLLDAELEALTSPYRRRVLLAVSERGAIDEDDAVADAFAAHGTGDDPDVLRLKLTHIHLPRLADQGYIEWDPDAGVIRRGPDFDDIAALLGAVADRAAE